MVLYNASSTWVPLFLCACWRKYSTWRLHEQVVKVLFQAFPNTEICKSLMGWRINNDHILYVFFNLIVTMRYNSNYDLDPMNLFLHYFSPIKSLTIARIIIDRVTYMVPKNNQSIVCESYFSHGSLKIYG